MSTIEETVLETVGTNPPAMTEEPSQQAPAPQAPEVANALTGKRANWVIAHKIEGEAITWQVKGAGALTLNLSAVSAANRNRAALHGFVQRVSDAAAMARDSKTGASATPQQKYDAMRRLVEHYSTGSEEWSPARVEGGAQGQRSRVDLDRELLAMALGIFNPAKDAGTIGEFVKGLKKEQVTGLLVSEQLKESVALAREEMDKAAMKVSEGVDAGELLKGL